jgi:acyl carrier protein
MTLAAEQDQLALGEAQQDSCESVARKAILARFRDVAHAQGKMLAPLTDELVLLDSGLDSLCFAIVVATLEDELGFDPFTEAEDVYFPATLGDFIRFYER